MNFLVTVYSGESSDADLAASVEDCTLQLQTPKEKGTETCTPAWNPHPHSPNLPFNFISSFLNVFEALKKEEGYHVGSNPDPSQKGHGRF